MNNKNSLEENWIVAPTQRIPLAGARNERRERVNKAFAELQESP
jgi:hypothetical protein